MADVHYVTQGWCVHDDRWTQALRDVGFDPDVIQVGRDVSAARDLADYISGREFADFPILAGPLDTVTGHLRDFGRRVVGLSWGFDIHRMDELAWLGDLGGVIVDSVATAELLREADVDPARITYLPWGVDLEAFPAAQPLVTRASLGIPDEAKVILSLRAHEQRYHVGDVINAFAEVAAVNPEAVLVVGSTGSLTEDLERQCTSPLIHDRVYFIGQRTESEVADLLVLADAYVSASEVDGTSVTLLQAMASGTPCVVSDIPGNRPWIHNGRTGWLFALRDSAHLARAIHQELASPGSTAHEARIQVEAEADWLVNRNRLVTALGNTGP